MMLNKRPHHPSSADRDLFLADVASRQELFVSYCSGIIGAGRYA
jgi:hypothetical protein